MRRLLGTITLVCCVSTGAAAENLAGNGGFSEGLANWRLNGQARQADIAVSAEAGVLRVAVPDTAEVGWYSVTQRIPAAPGQRFVADCDVLASDMRDGAGAVLGLWFQDAAGKRIHHASAFMPRCRNWVPMRVHGVAPGDAAFAAVALSANGHGEAAFRRVRLARAPTPQPKPLDGGVTLTIADPPSAHPFIGIGAEDDGFFYNNQNAEQGVDAAAIALREKRIEFLDPDWVRMFAWYRDWNPALDGETFTWDSSNMRSRRRSLDLYQRLGARVALCGVEWTYADRLVDQPENVARAVGALLEHLIADNGYTCIQDWTLTNEPNLSFIRYKGASFALFRKLHRLVRGQCRDRGIEVNIVGSDDGNGFGWFSQCVGDPAYRELPALYASHFYVPAHALPLGAAQTRDRIALLREHGVDAPFVIGELGVRDHRTQPPADNPYMREYGYALDLQTLLIDALAAGASGASVWCMHEVYYPGTKTPMHFGLWDFGGGWTLRPVFHAVAAFTRNTEAGEPLHAVASSHPQSVRAIVVGDTLLWANRAADTIAMRIEPPRGGAGRTYAEDSGFTRLETGTPVTFAPGNEFAVPPRSFGFVNLKP